MHPTPSRAKACPKIDPSCQDSDHEVSLTAQNSVYQVLREVHGRRPFRIQIRRINSAINTPWSQMPPSTGSLGLTRQNRSCTAIAADCGKALFVKGIQNHFVLVNVAF